MSARIRAPLAVAGLIALTFVSSLPAPAVAGTTSTVGWVRLAHLSPDTPPVDVYLYPYGGSTAQLVLKHVAYGTLSPYQSLAPGDYLVAMRGADAAATAKPVISAQVQVAVGQAYTVAGLGTSSALTLKVLADKLDTPQGKVSVRVIEASQRNPTASVNVGDDVLTAGLRFPDVSPYQLLAPGSRAVKVTTQAADKTTQLDFTAGSTYTLAVLDGSGSSPQILGLSDATGTSVAPKGGVSTGFGGTARQGGPGSAMPAGWVVLLVAALGSVGLVGFGLTRRRKRST